MNDKMKPALIGGVALGILSVIPIVNVVNLCCCAWAILGGVLAANLYIKSSPTPVKPADGAVVGALAGAVGAAINLVIGIPISIITGGASAAMMSSILANVNPDMAAQVAAQAQASAASTGAALAAAIPAALIGSICLIIFATIGGLIGVAVFEKRKGGDIPPPPPSGFGGPGAGA
jgi:hypothetical protein